MTHKPLISVIMPAYNAQKYISESIESVIEQSFTNWELIVVDDGSTDLTSSIIRQYCERDKRIKYFYQSNSKQGKAKNAGIKNSTGSLIAFLDADDLWTKDKLAVSMREMATGDYALLFTDCYVFEDSLPATFDGLKRIGVCEEVLAGKDALISFLHYNKIPNLTVLVKKEVIQKAGDFTEKIVAEEYEMWLRLLTHGAVFKSISTPLSLYRLHSESITATDRHATFEVIVIIKEFGYKYPEYKTETSPIIREKIKYWLYYGANRTPKKFRQLIEGEFSLPLRIFFYCLSFLLPVDQFRKVVIRSY